MRVSLIGATGAVGSAVLQELLENESIDSINIIARRTVELPTADEASKQKVNQTVVPDFDKLGEFEKAFATDVCICALGTTRSKSGAEGFVKVDRDYVISVANLAKKAGCESFHLVSSAKADKNSFFLYLKTKGEADDAVSHIGFNRVCIYRPMFLLTSRKESRPLETFSQTILGVFDRWRWSSIEVLKLAKVITACTLDKLEQGPGIKILCHRRLVELGENLAKK